MKAMRMNDDLISRIIFNMLIMRPLCHYGLDLETTQKLQDRNPEPLTRFMEMRYDRHPTGNDIIGQVMNIAYSSGHYVIKNNGYSMPDESIIYRAFCGLQSYRIVVQSSRVYNMYLIDLDIYKSVVDYVKEDLLRCILVHMARTKYTDDALWNAYAYIFSTYKLVHQVVSLRDFMRHFMIDKGWLIRTDSIVTPIRITPAGAAYVRNVKDKYYVYKGT